MGVGHSAVYWLGNVPEHIPPFNGTPQFDPLLGFKATRKPRVSILSQEEMKASQIDRNKRDYCAHRVRDLQICLNYYAPFRGLCGPEIRARNHCEMEDYVLRMKEYERERRLKLRELRKQGKRIE